MKYIGLSAETFSYKEHITWIPGNRQRMREGTEWALYYLHRDSKVGKVMEQEKAFEYGIGKAILQLKPFAKAEIVGYKPNECYIGTFETYGSEEEFIRLNMKLKGHGTKDLTMLVYLGKGDVEIALGQFNNLGEAIYSGTVMLEPVLNKTKMKNPIHFYKGDEVKKLPEHVHRFFEDKTKNKLRVPRGVTSLLEFGKWQAYYRAK